MPELLIFDKDDNLLTILSNEDNEACPFWNAPFKEVLNNGSTFEFSAPANHDDAKYIVEENQAAFIDKDGNFRLFVLKEPEYQNGIDGPLVRVVCEPAMNELSEEIIEDARPYNTTALVALTSALSGTRWKVGTVASLVDNSANFYYVSSIEAISSILNTWGGELRDRIEIQDNKITGRYIDILTRRGQDTGKRWEIDKDIISIKRRIQSYPKTALYGRGSSLETDSGGYTRKITFRDVEWRVANGDPVDKPLGQEWVGDPVALTLYGRKNSDGSRRHRKGIFEDGNQKDPSALLLQTWNSLQQVKHKFNVYEMDVFLLEHISGYEHEKARLGDTTFAIDRTLSRPIEIEERIISYTYDVSSPEDTGIVELGNYIDLYSDEDRLAKVESKLNEKGGIWDQAEGAIVEVDDNSILNQPPPIPSNVVVDGLFEMINIKWDFDPSIKVAGYEVYGSQISNFTIDSSNLLWRGKAGGYSHKAEPDQTWYFKIRAFNPAGEMSAFTEQFTGMTVRIDGAYIEQATIGDLHVKDVSADKIKFGTLDGNLATIVNINADNIVTGTLKAQFVKIGSATTYEEGYDPTKKLEYHIGSSAPTNKKMIWIDDTDPNNVLWKLYSETSSSWITGPSGPRGPEGLQGIQGPKGDQGIKGVDGANGVSSYTHIAYATNSSGTSGFSTSDSVNKTYIGMYVDSTPTDSTDPSKYKWTLIKGADGAQGIPGAAGVDGKTPYLHIAYATNATGTTGFSTTDATGKTYMGTYTDFVATDSTDPTKYTWVLVQGAQGVGISSVTEYYLATSASTGVTTSTNGWTTGIQTITPTNKYLWNYEVINYTNGSSTTTTPVILGVYGATGATGATGAAGKGISSVTEYYLATSLSSGVTTSTSGWSTTIQTTSTTNKYLWNYEVISYTDGSSSTINPIIIGTHGETGPQGIQGPAGSNGVSQYVHIRYSTASNGNPMTTTPAADTKYIGLANTTSSSAPTSYSSYTWSLFRGSDGAQGIQGPAGANGITTYTWVKYADTDTGSGLSDSPAGKRYIGLAFNKTTATESNTASDYVWSPLYDNVVVGGRNILLNSYRKITSAIYNIASYNLAETSLTDGDQVTISIKGQLGADRDYWGVYNSGGSVSLANLFPADRKSNGVYVKTFIWKKSVVSGTSTITASNTYLDLYHMTNTDTSESSIEWIKLERGNVATDWTPAPEDIQGQIDDKADTSDLDNLANIVSSVSADLNFKAGMGEFQALKESYEARMEQDVKDKQALSTALSTIEGRTALVETIANNNKLVAQFINTVITESEEGIYISNGASSTGILISSNRISFMDNNVEVAYISNQTMQINHGIFVESATISDFKFEKIPGTTILAIQWVGG